MAHFKHFLSVMSAFAIRPLKPLLRHPLHGPHPGGEPHAKMTSSPLPTFLSNILDSAVFYLHMPSHLACLVTYTAGHINKTHHKMHH